MDEGLTSLTTIIIGFDFATIRRKGMAVNKVLALVLIIFFGIDPSFADNRSSVAPSIEKRMSDNRSALTRLESDRDTLNSEIHRQEEILGAFRTSVEQAQRELDDEKGDGWVCFSRTCKQLKAKLEGARAHYEGARPTIERRINQKQTEIERINGRITLTDETFNTLSTNQQMGVLRQSLRATSLKADFNDLENRFENVGQTLDTLSSEFDRTLMGTYVQDKMTKLVNSKSFCEAKRRCDTGGRRKVNPSMVRNELFPESRAQRDDSHDFEPMRGRAGSGGTR